MLLRTKDGAFRTKDGAFKGDLGVCTEFDVKELTAEGEFECYLSTFGNVDKGNDIVMPGAFTESLRRRPASKVKMLLHHDTRRPCGVWRDMVEDGKGLKAKGQLLLSTQDGRETYELMRAGALDATSIGYRTLRDEHDRATGTRKLLELDLMEGSIVTFPMNEKATISRVKDVALTHQDLRDLEAVLREGGLSRTDAVKAVSSFKTWLRRDAGAPGSAPRDEVAPGAMAAVSAAFEGLAAQIRA